MNKGFTLIEITIATALFALSMSIILGIIFLSSEIYFQGERATEIMQNGRVVLDSASRELRQTRSLVTHLSEDDPSSEIVFQDGHLEEIRESGTAEGGELYSITLSGDSSSEDGFYEDVFIKITEGSLAGEIRKIVDYDGGTREAQLNLPFSEDTSYFGEKYIIDTSYYYIRYFLKENMVKREVYTYYFSGDENYYVPYNAVPPPGESLEQEILEDGRVIGEHFESLSFREENGVNILVELKKGRSEIMLLKKVFGRNL